MPDTIHIGKLVLSGPLLTALIAALAGYGALRLWAARDRGSRSGPWGDLTAGAALTAVVVWKFGVLFREPSLLWEEPRLLLVIVGSGLLAAVALTVCTTLLITSGRAKYAWVTGIPLAWDAAVTLTASYQKIFSPDPTLGFLAQRARFAEALAEGRVLAPAKDLDDMRAVVVNSTVDGILSAVFALLIIIVIANAVVVWYRALTSPTPWPTTEAPAVPSKIVAPSGLFATREEKEAMAMAAGGDRG